MHAAQLTDRLTAMLEPQAAIHGFELVAVEQAGGRGMPVLRVLLDREGGLDLDAIASASEWVSQALDADDPFGRPYTLEVSSPGIDRPLTRRDDFTRFAGQVASVKVAPSGDRRSWTGELVGMDADDVILLVDGERVRIPYETITKARLKGAVDFGTRKERST